MPDEQPRRRRALACPHSSLSGLGIPPSLFSLRQTFPSAAAAATPAQHPARATGREEERGAEGGRGDVSGDAGLCLRPCSRHLMQEALLCGIFSSRGTTDAVTSAPR